MGSGATFEFGIHNHENTHDLIFTEIISDIRITRVTPGEFLSDHRWVDCELSLRGLQTISHKKKIQMFRSINMEKLLDAMKVDEIHSSYLDDLISQFTT